MKNRQKLTQQNIVKDGATHASEARQDQAAATPEMHDAVLVVTINFDHGESPGMLSAEKVSVVYVALLAFS